MLRLLDISPSYSKPRGPTYRVILDRDGSEVHYWFTWIRPSRPGRLPSLHHPPRIVSDLLAYQALPPDDRQPASALVIPALDAIVQAVYQVADGEPVELPIVLDER